MLQNNSGTVRLSELKVKYNSNIISNPITSSGESYNLFRKIWKRELINITEEVYILFLNRNNEAMCYRCLNTGNQEETLFNIKLALSCALACLSSGIIIAHNHPSGSLKPSIGDIAITTKFFSACQNCDIKLIDHLIINEHGYFSFIDNKVVFKK